MQRKELCAQRGICVFYFIVGPDKRLSFLCLSAALLFFFCVVWKKCLLSANLWWPEVIYYRSQWRCIAFDDKLNLNVFTIERVASSYDLVKCLLINFTKISFFNRYFIIKIFFRSHLILFLQLFSWQSKTVYSLCQFSLKIK